jgi:hypothetical protein
LRNAVAHRDVFDHDPVLLEQPFAIYENTRTQTISAAGQGYLGVLLAEALMALQPEDLGLTKESPGITKAQESFGEVPYRNVLRWQSQAYADQQQVVAQKSGLLESRFRFNQVRNRRRGIASPHRGSEVLKC